MMKVDLLYIILGLFIGFLLVYVFSPAPKIILKYPTLNSTTNKTYVDENGTCYKYNPKIVPC